jgi:hypothetical protein
MTDFETALKQLGVPTSTCTIICFYCKPETLQAVLEGLEGGDDDVDQLQPESTPRSC